MKIPGIHHVTAIAGDPQLNVDFYAGVLGLRLVKQTVNFDDPATYHLYYGDAAGTPGTILTFFPWKGAPHGRRGPGQTAAVSFRVGAGALEHWRQLLQSHKVQVHGPHERFGDPYIAFEDPDGMALEIVASGTGGEKIHGFHSVALAESSIDATATLLTDEFGYERIGVEGNRTRFGVSGSSEGRVVDLLSEPETRRGMVARGSVHHVAFRATSQAQQLEWRAALSKAGHEVTPVLDRQYFESIYFREPGGVLFEIATDPPGFAIDEAPGQLGQALKLPPWLEPQRAEIEAVLPKLHNPEHAHHAS